MTNRTEFSLRSVVARVVLVVMIPLSSGTLLHAQTPVITAISAPRQIVNLGQGLTLSVTATGSPAPTYQWKRNGLPVSAATNATYTITNAAPVRDNGWYRVVVTNSSGSTTSAVVFVNVAVSPANIVGIGGNIYGQTTIPAGLTSVVAVGAGPVHSLALKADGTVTGWGNNSNGQTTIPVGLTGVVAVVGGGYYSLALKSDGTVVGWGDNLYGQTSAPTGLSGVVAIAAGDFHSLALKSDGTVITWGANSVGQTALPAGLAGVVAISAGGTHSLALKGDGTVVAWGNNNYGQTTLPGGLVNVAAVAGGGFHSLALKGDGTVVAWGRSAFGPTTVPASLVGVVAIAGGGYHSLALKADGTVTAWGNNDIGQTTIPAGLSRVVAVAGGVEHCLLLRDATGEIAPAIITQPLAQTVTAGVSVTFSVTSNGAAPLSYQWRKNGTNTVGATNSILTIPSAQGVDAGSYDVVVTNSAGSVTSNTVTLTVTPTFPTLANVSVQRRAGTKLVDITFDLVHAQSLASTITVEVSSDGGTTWSGSPLTLTGAIGASIAPGAGKLITWTAGADWPAQSFAAVGVRVTANDGQSGLVRIPGGTFTMGDNLDSAPAAQPTHAVTLPTFYLEKMETTWADWLSVRDWAVTHGYADLAFIGSGKASTHPVQMVSWYDVVKWLNAKSEKDGIVPVYYTNDTQTTVYRAGVVDITAIQVKWTASGYRLPTEAEWEYAARGGLTGKRFPWGDTITHQQANYESVGYSYDLSATRGFHPSYATESKPYTSPIGSFSANGYGLLDLAGNVWEWCWDWYGSYSIAAVITPLGSGSGGGRVLRGGSWGHHEVSARTSNRIYNPPDYRWNYLGFRPARSSAVDGSIVSANSAVFALDLSDSSVAPAITTQPSNQTVTVGQAARLTIVATGTPAPTYQWRKSGTNIIGATNASYTMGSAQTSDTGSFDVVVSNSAGSVTSTTATLTVNLPPTISTQPQSQSVPAGSSVNLTVTASGTTPFAYQWRKDGTAIGGATNPVFSLANVQAGDAGSYSVIVANATGSVTSNAVTLIVNVPPMITAQSVNQTVSAGQTATFTVVATAAPVPTYQWRKDGVAVPGATAATLTINNAQAGDAGSYDVVVTNLVSTATSAAAFLTVNVPPTITSQPSAQTVTAGLTASFTVVAGGTAPLTYQWRKDGTAIGGATTATYAVTNVTAGGAGSYSVTTSNAAGSITSTGATLTVNTPPLITTQPQGASLIAGQSASFTVVATAAPAPTYQWRKDGVAIPGATGTTLTFNYTQPSDAGSYTVVVTNAAGSTVSAANVLAVAFTRLINLSILSSLDSSGDNFTLGYVVGGSGTSGPKPLIIRAAGPSLGALGVPDTLDDPKFELFAGATKTGENDNWGGTTTVASAMAAVGAFAYTGPNSRDAAVALSVARGDNSVKVSAAGAGTGVVIAEIYDGTPTASFTGTTPRLVNVSVIKQLGAGFTIGFTVGGAGIKNVLIRAIGPTLNSAFGVGGAVADPQLTVYSGQTPIASNDNWGGGTALSSAFSSVAAFALPVASRDAAVATSLNPGNYTVQVSGVSGVTGTILVEVYELP